MSCLSLNTFRFHISVLVMIMYILVTEFSAKNMGLRCIGYYTTHWLLAEIAGHPLEDILHN